MSDWAAAEMPRYRCHKEVWALHILHVIGDVLEFHDQGYAPLQVGSDFIHKHNPQPGGYYVVYADGYKSYSPAKAFEDGYSAVSTIPPSMTVAKLGEINQRYVSVVDADGSIRVCEDFHRIMEEDIPDLMNELARLLGVFAKAQSE